jgi:hypothetical protein
MQDDHNEPPPPETTERSPNYTKHFLDQACAVGDFVSRNPGIVAGGAVVSIGSYFFVAPVVLSAVGFTTIGPAAGSYAASWMSSIGVVQAGSIYSGIQSVAMGGAYATTVNGTTGAVLGGATTWGLNRLFGRSPDNPPTDQPPDNLTDQPPDNPTGQPAKTDPPSDNTIDLLV